MLQMFVWSLSLYNIIEIKVSFFYAKSRTCSFIVSKLSFLSGAFADFRNHKNESWNLKRGRKCECNIEIQNCLFYPHHIFRHTYATRCYENGVDQQVVQTLLGHSTLAMTTDLYTHVSEEKKKEEVAELKILA